MSTYTGPERHVSLAERRDIIAAVLAPAPLDWEPGGEWAYVECPGMGCHSNANGRRDCRVYAMESPGQRVKPPGLYCLHTSCAGVLAPLNFKIRSEIGKAKARRDGSQPGASSRGGSPRTVRTPVFKAPAGGGADPRTVRTDIPKPLDRFARAQVRAQEPPSPALLPSAPSVVAQPIAQSVAHTPKNTPALGVKAPIAPNQTGHTEKEACGEITFIGGDGIERGYFKNGSWVPTKTLCRQEKQAKGNQ